MSALVCYCVLQLPEALGLGDDVMYECIVGTQTGRLLNLGMSQRWQIRILQDVSPVVNMDVMHRIIFLAGSPSIRPSATACCGELDTYVFVSKYVPYP